MTDFPDNTNTGGDILVVDDLPDNLKLLGEILKSSGHRFRPMTNGPMALRSIAKQLPELILLDISMPEMDGFEVCRQLKANEHSRDIPVIFISAKEDVPDKVKAFGLGGVDYISKPFEAEEVLARVETHLALSRLRCQLEEQVAERTRNLEETFASLKESEETLKQAQEVVHMGSLSLDFITKEEAWSDEAFRLLGYQPGEVEPSAESFLKRVHPDDGERIVQAFNEAISEKKRFSYEFRAIHPDGTEHILRTEGDVIFNETGVALKMIGTVLDITERKRAEEALRQEKEFIETALNSQSDTFFVFDISTGKALRWNKAFRDVSGYSDEEIGSMKAPDSWYDDEDLQIAGKALENIYEVGQSEVVLSLVTKDGKRVPTEYNSSIIKDASGQPKQIISIGRDITERLEAQKTLQDREQNLAITLNSIGDAVITTDADGHVTRMNPVAEQLTGWSLEDAQGQTVKSIFPIVNAASREPIENPIDKVMASGEIVHLSNHTALIAKDGTEHQIADSAAPIRDGDGDVQGMVLVFNDVTEQYQLREAAAKSRRNLQAILDNSPAVIYAKDIEGRYIFINQKLAQLFDMQNEGIIGKTDYEIFSKEFADGFTYNDKAVLATRHALESEEIAPHDDGPHTYVALKFPLFDENENIYAICGISTDITERKNMENALQESEYNLLKAQGMAKIGNWKLNPETGKVEGSKELLKLFELGDDDITLDNFASVVHPDDREYDLKHIQNGIEHGIPWDIEHRLLLKDGSIKWVHAVGEPMLDNDGKTINVIGIVQDITARKQADEILRRSQKMDALGKLTGGVAHDYNNMLGIILGYSELLEEGLSEQPKLAKYAQEIHHAGGRGSKLTKKLLSFSRKKSSDAEVLNINTLLHEEQHMLEKTLTVRIKLVLDLAEGLWPVWLDSGDLEDAIINTSINAMHAIEGQGQLTIQTRNTSVDAKDAKLLNIDAGEYVLLSIIDTGSGMDEATKERMFEPFYSTKGEKGTGLGLSQVYGFVQRSGGAIKVYSELGNGTRLMLYFPRHHEKDSGDKLVTTSDAAILGGKETILLVDDEAALLDLNAEILAQQGYRILCAGSGKQALEILENESVDLLLSDVIMPEMDGYQLVSIVQQKYPDIKIQLASGFSDEGHVDMVDDILHQNMLRKPYRSQTLLKRIRKLLGKK